MTSQLPAWAERTETGGVRCTVCGAESPELPVDHDCIYANGLVADGGQPATDEAGTHARGPSQPTDPELTHYRVGVIDLYLHDWAEGTRLYTTAGTTTSVREMAEHDGPVILDGKFRKMIEDGTVVEQHPHAGYCGAWTVNDETAHPATLLKEVHRHV